MAEQFAHSEQHGKRAIASHVRYLRRECGAGARYAVPAMDLRLREIREAKGLTVEQLADAVGMSKSYLSEIETGKKTVNARRIEAFAKVLGCRPSDLLADRDLSAEIQAHVDLLSRMSDGDRRDVLAYARFRGAGEPAK
jgi:transcriptional regulator with XRE-family HTH domain